MDQGRNPQFYRLADDRAADITARADAQVGLEFAQNPLGFRGGGHDAHQRFHVAGHRLHGQLALKAGDGDALERKARFRHQTFLHPAFGAHI